MNELFKGYKETFIEEKPYGRCWSGRLNSFCDSHGELKIDFKVQFSKRKEWYLEVSYEDPMPKLVRIFGTKGFDKACVIAIAEKMAEVQFDWLQYLHRIQKDDEVF